MEVDFVLLADSAEVVNGKLYLMGGAIDTIWSSQVPMTYHRPIAFVLRLMLDVAEIGRKHKLEIQIMDEDGKIITNVGGDLQIQTKSPDLPHGWRQGFVTVLNFQNLQFSKFGSYSFNIMVNNSALKSIPLRLAQRMEIPKQEV